MNDLLTVLLTLKGRDHHTLRWLKYANDNSFPFPIYVADGQPCTEVRDFLKNDANTANISFEYHEYNDADRIAFYSKVRDSLNRIKSKYVIFCGNNDFLVLPGLMKCISFLEQNEDYVCAGGGVSCMVLKANDNEYLSGDVLGFAYDDAVVNHLSGFTFDPHNVYKSKSYEEDSAVARMMSSLAEYRLIFYHVYRTAAWRKIASDVTDLRFESPNIHEYFMALRALTLGKVKSFPEYLTLIRGDRAVGNVESPENSRDLKMLLHHFLHSSYTEDIKKCMDRLEQVLSSSGDIRTGTEMDLLRMAFTNRQYMALPGVPATRDIENTHGASNRAISKSKNMQAALALMTKRLTQRGVSPPSSDEAKMFLLNKLQEFGSDRGFLEEVSAELDRIQLCLRNIPRERPKV